MFNERTKCPAERKMMSVTASYPTRDCDLTSLPVAVVRKIYVAAKRTFQKRFRNVCIIVFYVCSPPWALISQLSELPWQCCCAANGVKRKVTLHAGNVVFLLTSIWLDWQRLFWCAFVVVLLFWKEISRQNNPNLRGWNAKSAPVRVAETNFEMFVFSSLYLYVGQLAIHIPSCFSTSNY